MNRRYTLSIVIALVMAMLAVSLFGCGGQQQPAAPKAEEPAAEEPAAEAGSPDAAVLVETIAGITIAAVLHYANKLKTVNCKKGTAAIGAVDYVAGMVTPVAEEIADPDGKMSIPAVTIDLSECAD